jgi:AAA family ATP:ADP antiporter
MFKRIATALWGKFESAQEVKKFLFLGSIFGLIIGVYWGLRPLKDSLFNQIVGFDYQPIAKILSAFVIMILVLGYSKLVDRYPRHQILYFLTVVYGLLMLGFAFAFMHDSIGLAQAASGNHRWLGWSWYVFVESFGTLIVPLFWAITADITLPASAQRGFPLIALFGQLGNIFGPAALKATHYGFASSAPIVAICGGLVFLTVCLMVLFRSITPANELAGYHVEGEKESEPGFFEGLKLLVTQGYLFGIFLVNFFYEVIVTILDFHFKGSVFAEHTAETAGSGFLSDYATMVGVVSTACVLLGINNIQRRLGMNASLVLVPVLVIVAVVVIWFNPTSLTALFVIMVASKAVNYALNQPTIKQLYIPTSKDAKFKAQAWSELFGSRGAKASASGFNTLKKSFFMAKFGPAQGALMFVSVSSVLSLGLIGGWLVICMYLARVYNRAIAHDKIVC